MDPRDSDTCCGIDALHALADRGGRQGGGGVGAGKQIEHLFKGIIMENHQYYDLVFSC